MVEIASWRSLWVCFWDLRLICEAQRWTSVVLLIHFKQCCCASIHRQKSMGFELEKILGNFIIIKFRVLGFELEKILGNFLLNSEFWISN
jgi:hypothetical protein